MKQISLISTKGLHPLAETVNMELLSLQSKNHRIDRLSFWSLCVPSDGIGNVYLQYHYCAIEYSSTVPSSITIHVRGGMVDEVTNLPEDWDYKIIDHDVSEQDFEGN